MSLKVNLRIIFFNPFFPLVLLSLKFGSHSRETQTFHTSFQFLPGDLEVLPGQKDYTVSPFQLVQGWFQGVPLLGCAWKTSRESCPGGILIKCYNYLSWILSMHRRSSSHSSFLWMMDILCPTSKTKFTMWCLLLWTNIRKYLIMSSSPPDQQQILSSVRNFSGKVMQRDCCFNQRSWSLHSCFLFHILLHFDWMLNDEQCIFF